MADSANTRYGNSERSELIPFIPDSARSLLDVGCGAGGFAHNLRRSRPGMELWAVEPDPVAAQIAEDAFDKVIVSEFPAGGIPDARFDVVLCADVLEHMAEPEKALAAAADALTENGIMLASIPNVRNWHHVVWPLIRSGSWKYTDTGILDRTHLRFFTRGSIIEFFTENNWSVKTVAGIRTTGRRARLMSAITGRRVDDFIFRQYIVVARPNSRNSCPTFLVSPR